MNPTQPESTLSPHPSPLKPVIEEDVATQLVDYGSDMAGMELREAVMEVYSDEWKREEVSAVALADLARLEASPDPSKEDAFADAVSPERRA